MISYIYSEDNIPSLLSIYSDLLYNITTGCFDYWETIEKFERGDGTFSELIEFDLWEKFYDCNA